jgi:hypothetical protein
MTAVASSRVRTQTAMTEAMRKGLRAGQPAEDRASGLRHMGNAIPILRLRLLPGWANLRTSWSRVLWGSCPLICMSLLLVLGGCEKGSTEVTGKGQFEVEQVHERGPATVRVRLDKTKMSIADTVLLQIEASLPPDYRIEMPRVDRALKQFGIVDWSRLPDRLDAENNVVTTVRYRLEPFLLGGHEIPAFTFVFHDVNEPDTKYELVSRPVAVEVTSVLGDQQAELVIEDIEGIMEMPEPARWWWLWIPAVLGIVAVPAAWLLLRNRRVKGIEGAYVPAHEIAYANLRALVARKLVEQGRIKEYYERISGILRYYIEHRFDLHAPDRTTEEFLFELQSTDTLTLPDKEVLKEFLTHCDLVKFAKHVPTAEQTQRTFDLVKDFVERTKSDERKVYVAACLGTVPAAKAEVA